MSTTNPAVSTRPWSAWLSYALIAAFVAWCGLALGKDIAAIDFGPVAAGWPLIAAAAALSLLNYLARVVRWRAFIGALGLRLPWRFAALTFMSGFAFTLSPGKVGEVIRARYYAPLGLGMVDVAAAFFAERLQDLLAMIVIAAFAVVALQGYGLFLSLALGLVAALVGVAQLCPWARLESRFAQRPGRVAGALAKLAGLFVRSRRFFAMRYFAGGLALALVAWGLEAFGLWLLCEAVAPSAISLPVAMGIYSLAVVVGALSFLPGGLGSTEAAMAGLLSAQGLPLPQALLATLLCRLLTLWLAVAIGWLCIALLRGAPIGRTAQLGTQA
ncbi:MAG: lysylphosphatidylglycerol synthase transmembrane domain-containing protein [Solimonas sp.]